MEQLRNRVRDLEHELALTRAVAQERQRVIEAQQLALRPIESGRHMAPATPEAETRPLATAEEKPAREPEQKFSQSDPETSAPPAAPVKSRWRRWFG